MRFSKVLLTAAAGLAAFAAAAQDSPPAEEPPATAEPGLSDLEETVDRLLDEDTIPPAQPEAPEQESAPAETAAPAAQEAAESADSAASASEAPAPVRPATAAATTPSGPAPRLTRAQIATLDETVERGRLLVAIARAGIMATQDMLTRVSDPNGAGISGWIAEPAGNSMLVTFYADPADGETGPARAVYRATVLGGRVTSREMFLGADRPALSPLPARMAAARAASENAELRACTDQPFNVLVVPPASATAPVDVYRISTPAARGRFPLGGHFRSTVTADGNVETRNFANACTSLDASPLGEGQQPAPIGVTHLLDPLPTEVHLLLAQTIGRPLLVVTGEPQRIWLVTGDRIAEVRDQASR